MNRMFGLPPDAPGAPYFEAALASGVVAAGLVCAAAPGAGFGVGVGVCACAQAGPARSPKTSNGRQAIEWLDMSGLLFRNGDDGRAKDSGRNDGDRPIHGTMNECAGRAARFAAARRTVAADRPS